MIINNKNGCQSDSHFVFKGYQFYYQEITQITQDIS